MNLNQLFEASQLCPECGGISFSDLILAEKKDACYYKVKASAKVWPSAYASGRLVQCRKKGAANYGNKSEGVAEANDPNFVGFMNKALSNKVDAKPEQPKTGHDWYDNAPTMSMNNMPSYKHAFKFGMSVLQSMDIETKQHFAEADNDTLFSYLMKLARKKGFSPKYFVEEDMIEVPDLFNEIFHDPSMEGWEWADLLRSTLKGQGMAEEQELDEKWSQKYKSSINCANPKGFSQKAHCAGRNKNEDVAEGGAGSGRPDPTAWDNSSGKVGRVEKTATGLRHHADHSRYGGTIPDPEHDKLLNPQQRWRLDKITQPVDDMDEGEQQKGADYRDPREVDYDDEYDAMVARVKKLAGLGPMKTVYDPNKRQYRNMPTAQQPKK